MLKLLYLVINCMYTCTVTFFWMKLGRANNANEGGVVQRPLSEVNNNSTCDIRVCAVFREARLYMS